MLKQFGVRPLPVSAITLIYASKASCVAALALVEAPEATVPETASKVVGSCRVCGYVGTLGTVRRPEH